jgi:hypothetical protein
MKGLWSAVVLTCLRKDWLGYAAFLGVGVFAYPNPSLLLALACLAFFAAIFAVRALLTYLHIKGKISGLSSRSESNEVSDLSAFCNTHITGIFG